MIAALLSLTLFPGAIEATPFSCQPLDDDAGLALNHEASVTTGATITDEGATDADEVRIPRDGNPKKSARIRVSFPASLP